MTTSPALETLCATVLREVTVAGMAEAASRYQPTSYDDGQRVLQLVVSRLDTQALALADAGRDAEYDALRALRDALLRDYSAKTATLSRLRDFTFSAPLPALTLAQRLYRTATRTDELVKVADPVHPAFMPVAIRALAA